MGGGFYKVNNEVLKMDVIKNKDEILFNHYLMQQENIQRLKNELPKGQFYLAKRSVALKLGIDNTKAQRLITKFVKLNIITPIKKSNNRTTPSIYLYNSIEKIEPVIEPINELVNEPVKYRNKQCLDNIDKLVNEPIGEPVNEPLKKEILKRNIKNNNISKDIYVSTGVDLVIEKWNSLNLSKIVNIKGNRLKMLNARIKEYEIGGILTAIENIEKSNFLKGQNNKNWIITFDWFIRPNNFIKVLEGNYTNRKGKPQYEANRVLERVYE